MPLVVLFFLATLLLWFWIFKENCSLCRKLGITFLGSGYILQLVELFFSFKSGNGNIFFLLSVAVLSIFYFLCWKFRNWNGIYFSPLIATLAFLFTLVGSKVGNFQRVNFLIIIHVSLAITSFSFLLISAIASVMHFIAERYLKSGNINLPLNIPINFWSNLERRLFFFGFIFLTLDLVFNVFLLKETLSHFVFDSRIMGTFVIWLYYGLLFHLQKFGVKVVKNHFYLFNGLGGIAVISLLLFTHHRF